METSVKFRSKFFIYPSFQITLLVANALVNAYLASFLAIRMRGFFEALTFAGKTAGFDTNPAFQAFIEGQQVQLNQEVWIAFGISLVLSTALTLWLSHRMAGPLVRLRDHLIVVARNGVFQKIRFRDRDYFRDLPQALNDAFESIEQKRKP